MSRRPALSEYVRPDDFPVDPKHGLNEDGALAVDLVSAGLPCVHG